MSSVQNAHYCEERPNSFDIITKGLEVSSTDLNSLRSTGDIPKFQFSSGKFLKVGRENRIMRLVKKTESGCGIDENLGIFQ